MLRLSLVQTTLPQDRWLSSQTPETVFLAEERGMHAVPVRSLGEAVTLLKEGQVDAVVHDTPPLRYYLKNNPDSRLALAPQTFEIFTYGITYPGGQPMAGETRSSADKDTGGRHLRKVTHQMVRVVGMSCYSISGLVLRDVVLMLTCIVSYTLRQRLDDRNGVAVLDARMIREEKG